MDKTAKISDEFASAMQQLSAQAEQTTHLEYLRLEQQGNGAADDAVPHIVSGRPPAFSTDPEPGNLTRGKRWGKCE